MSRTPDLRVNLENPLPAPLPVGSATAVFCIGTCFHPREVVEQLEIVVDGESRYRPAAFGMPRPDIYNMLQDARAYRSGFWATVPIEPRDRAGAIELAVAARLKGGTEEVVSLGRLQVVEPASPPPRPELDQPGLIAVCMATYEPDIALFRTQIESLRAQTDDRWTCVISDDCSSEERFEEMREVLAGDPRFSVSRAGERARFYRNFERALSLAPAEAELFALCDQDDHWYPDKLSVLRRSLGDAQLVYSDQRLVDAGGRVLRDSMWKGRRNNHTDVASLLVANSITGAATLFRREVAELALPFPETPGMQFHDHWLGLVALAAGDIAYVDRPLYDYVQHGGAIFGDVAGGADPAAASPPAPKRSLLNALLDRFRGGRGAYFLGYLPRDMQARALLVRCDGRLTASKRRALTRFTDSAHSPPAFVWLVARSLRTLTGRNETLGSESELARGILWRWLVEILAKGSRTPGRWPIDARYPDPLSFEQKRLRRWRARA